MEIISQWFFFLFFFYLISHFSHSVFILKHLSLMFCLFCFPCNFKMCVCVFFFALLYNKCGEYRFLVCSPYIFWRKCFCFYYSFFFAVLKRFVVCMCDFVGFGYGIFFDFWIQFREHAFDDSIVFVWVFSEIVTFGANRNNSTVCNGFI